MRYNTVLVTTFTQTLPNRNTDGVMGRPCCSNKLTKDARSGPYRRTGSGMRFAGFDVSHPNELGQAPLARSCQGRLVGGLKVRTVDLLSRRAWRFLPRVPVLSGSAWGQIWTERTQDGVQETLGGTHVASGEHMRPSQQHLV